MRQTSDQASVTPPPASWRVGDVTITRIVEAQHVFPVELLFHNATTEAVLELPWLQPHFLTPDGQVLFSFHALVVDAPGKRILVDTCYGNDKDRMPQDLFTNLQTSFLHDLEAAGFSRDSIDVVLCTHLHVDHVGWNTMLVEGTWVPTFPMARYIFSKADFEYWSHPTDVPTSGGWADVQAKGFEDSVRPVVEAGLVDLVDSHHAICDEVSLVPTPGHSPGHVSVRIVSQGQEALITGDIAHHPSQLAYLDWAPDIDFDPEQAVETRLQVFGDAADRSVLVIGTHWAGATAGMIHRCGDTFRVECQSNT